MAKSTDTTTVDPVVQSVAEETVQASNFNVTLDEFCKRLSLKKVGPELISGFHHAQKKAGNVKDSDAVYSAAFANFVKQPA